MTRNLHLVVLLLCLCNKTNAQTDIDSLKTVIKNTKQDTTKVNAYLQLFHTNLFYDNPKELLDYTYRALKISKKSNYNHGIVTAYNNLGYIYRTKSELDSATYYYKKAILKSEKIKHYKGLTDAHIGFGNTLIQLNRWDDANMEFEKVIALARKQGDSIQIASANNNIGNSYLNQSKYEDALKHYQKSVDFGDDAIREVALINTAVVHSQIGNLKMARIKYTESLELAKKLNKKGHIAFIYKNLGILEKKSENFDLAIDYYNKALAHYKTISDDFNTSEILQNIGNVYLSKKDYQTALNYYNESLDIQKTIGLKSGMCYNYLFIGQCYAALGQLDKALEATQEVEICAEQLDMLNLKSDASQLMSDILSQTGNYKTALDYYIIHKTLSDSLAAINSREKVAELDTKYETSKKEQEIDLLNAENEVNTLQLQHQRNIKNYMILAAILLFILIAVLYNRYQIKARTNNKLRELDQVKTNFFTNISHEFRTPLTLILNPLSKMLENDQEMVDKDQLIVVKRNAERLLELTNQLLDLSKLEAGKLELHIAKHNLKNFIEIVVASFSSLADSKHINFQVEAANLPDDAFFDSDKLQKIMNNLLSNAFKFTPIHETVLLKAQVINNDLTLLVQDSGPGIQKEEREKIFERYHQSNANGEQGGTGVGLTLTKELVQLHKGTIIVESEKAKGSAFTVIIPIKKKSYASFKIDESVKISQFNLPSESVENQSSTELLSEKPIALIVEDNPDLRNYIAALLADTYQIIYSQNGQEGLDNAIAHIPDVIVSDWMMPEMDGYEMCKNLKIDERTSHIPIILLTAKADHPSKLDALQLGADDYITKPFDNKELQIRVDNLVAQRAKLREKFSERILLEPNQTDIAEPDRNFIEKAKAIVEKNLSDTDFSVERFQEELGMSKSQLHRKLVALTNESASKFIRNFRLLKATQYFDLHGYQVSEVAYQCGFNSVSYFAQCFKEKFGMTPTEYQNQQEHHK